MKAIISLADELRAIRTGNGHGRIRGGLTGEKEEIQTVDPVEAESPSRSNPEQGHAALHEVKHAISHILGSEQPKPNENSEDAGSASTQMDFKALKELIHSELEAYSKSAADEMAVQTQEKTRAALEEVQREVNSRVDQVASELREKLQERLDPDQMGINVAEQSKERATEVVRTQTEEFARWVWTMCKGSEIPIPEQIGKLLEPYAEEAAARITGSFRQQIEGLLEEEERKARERFQTMLESFQSQISGMEQVGQQICDRNAELIKKLNAVTAAADKETEAFESRVRDQIEQSVSQVAVQLESSGQSAIEKHRQELAQLSAASIEEQRRAVTDAVTDLFVRLKQAAAPGVKDDSQD